MAKKQINYSDLSSKELEQLKDIYVDLKVKSMSNNDLKEFATENISLQIKNTIGNEEELEAWLEMEEFFKDEFEDTIRNLQIKMKTKNNDYINSNIEKFELGTEDLEEEKKLDMWED